MSWRLWRIFVSILQQWQNWQVVFSFISRTEFDFVYFESISYLFFWFRERYLWTINRKSSCSFNYFVEVNGKMEFRLNQDFLVLMMIYLQKWPRVISHGPSDNRSWQISSIWELCMFFQWESLAQFPLETEPRAFLVRMNSYWRRF